MKVVNWGETSFDLSEKGPKAYITDKGVLCPACADGVGVAFISYDSELVCVDCGNLVAFNQEE